MSIDWERIWQIAKLFSRGINEQDRDDIQGDIIVEIAEEAEKKEMTEERMKTIAKKVIQRHRREQIYYAGRFSSLDVLVKEGGETMPLEETIPSDMEHI